MKKKLISFVPLVVVAICMFYRPSLQDAAASGSGCLNNKDAWCSEPGRQTQGSCVYTNKGSKYTLCMGDDGYGLSCTNVHYDCVITLSKISGPFYCPATLVITNGTTQTITVGNCFE